MNSAGSEETSPPQILEEMGPTEWEADEMPFPSVAWASTLQLGPRAHGWICSMRPKRVMWKFTANRVFPHKVLHCYSSSLEPTSLFLHSYEMLSTRTATVKRRKEVFRNIKREAWLGQSILRYRLLQWGGEDWAKGISYIPHVSRATPSMWRSHRMDTVRSWWGSWLPLDLLSLYILSFPGLMLTLGELQTMLQGGQRTLRFQVDVSEVPWHWANSFPGHSLVETY